MSASWRTERHSPAPGWCTRRGSWRRERRWRRSRTEQSIPGKPRCWKRSRRLRIGGSRGVGISARHLSPSRAREAIEHAARAALAAPQDAPVFDPGAPCTIRVELNTSDQADPFRNRTDVTVTGSRTLEATAGTWWEAWRAIYLTR